MTLPSIPPASLPAVPRGRRGGLSTPDTAPGRKRGGQPGNQNARRSGTFSLRQPGPLSPIRAQIRVLGQLQQSRALPPEETVRHARALREHLRPAVPLLVHDSITVLNLSLKLALIVARAAAPAIPARRRQAALQAIALDPFAYFHRECEDSGVSRDADSFFFVSELSARNSSLPPSHPRLATNLTDEQWAVLSPLIPPDPRVDWLSGQPPLIIAANRWGFSRYRPGSELNDLVILQEQDRILQRCPGLAALAAPPLPAPPRRKRGRPRTPPASPRALLDAILWKLATGHTWKDLPAGFPPPRLCRDYYRRLFLSGRLYTLLLALYNHLRFDARIETRSLVAAGVFTTTPNQRIALSPGVPPTWQNYTALLFMQLARRTYCRLQREWARENPFHLPLPDLKGGALPSTGELAAEHPAQVRPAVCSPQGKLHSDLSRAPLAPRSVVLYSCSMPPRPRNDQTPKPTAIHGSRESALGYVKQNEPRFLRELEALVRIRTISSDPGHRTDMAAAARWLLERLQAAGLERVEIIPTRRHPLVYAEALGAGLSAPTLLICGHYDVQDPRPLQDWDTPPFEPTIKGDNLFGRGTTDMKGQLMAAIAAAEGLIRAGSPPLNLKFLLDGGAEIGSPPAWASSLRTIANNSLATASSSRTPAECPIRRPP